MCSRSAAATSCRSTTAWCSTPPPTGRAARSRWPSDGRVKITFLCPHLHIAGGVRAILTYADRLAATGHDVAVVVEAKGRGRALWRSLTGAGPAWVRGFRARVVWVDRWRGGAPPPGGAGGGAGLPAGGGRPPPAPPRGR